MEAPKHKLNLYEVFTSQSLGTKLIGLVEQKLKGAAETMRMAPMCSAQFLGNHAQYVFLGAPCKCG